MMSSPDLFGSGPLQVFEDAEGGVRYRPGFVDPATAARWFAALREAATLLRAELGTPFNSVGLNFYRDERDSVAPHGDKLHMITPGHPIALLSLGSTRRMVIRAKPPARDARRIDLAPGSLLLMSHASQLTHDHGVPKQRAPAGERISLAFRVRPQP